VLDIWTNDFVIKEQELAEKETGVPSKNYITADIALHGSDRFVLGAWHGMALVEIIAVDKIGAQDVEQMIRDLAKKHTVPQSRIVYDADGIGAYLEGYIGGAIPFHNGGTPIKDLMSERVNFKHLKAQCFFKLAQIIDKMFVADDTYQEQIVEELTAIKKKLSGDQKMSVTSKDEVKEMIGRSPDFADMIMMRTRFELDTFTGEYEFA
jgi:phage terminase large subunit